MVGVVVAHVIIVPGLRTLDSGLSIKLKRNIKLTILTRKLVYCDFFDSPDAEDAKRFNHLQRQVRFKSQKFMFQ